jgi:hypothetical protein
MAIHAAAAMPAHFATHRGRARPKATTDGAERRAFAKPREISSRSALVSDNRVGRRHAGVGAESTSETLSVGDAAALCEAVAIKLAVEWSPQQIAGSLRHAYPADPEMQASRNDLSQPLRAEPRRTQKGAGGAPTDARSTRRRTLEGALSMRCRFASVLRRSRTARSPGIGKGICCRGR